MFDSWQFPCAVIWCHELGRNTKLWENLGGLLPPLICKGPRMSFKVLLQFFGTDIKISFGLELSKLFIFWVFGPFSSNSAHFGSLLWSLMNWTGHKILGHSGPGSTPLSGYGKSVKSLNLSDSLTECSLWQDVHHNVAWGLREIAHDAWREVSSTRM